MKCAIFDLDGTLLDTSPGIYESVRYAADKLGYPQPSREQLMSFIGPPLKVSFLRCYGCDDVEADRLTAAYREHYREGALLHAVPYEGIFALCEALCDSGVQVAVATSKPQQFSELILRHFGFDRYLAAVHGADLSGKLTKTDLIRACVEDVKALPAECVMIGDTEHDSRGAQEAGVPFIAARYGFGCPEEMAKYPSIGVARVPLEILHIIEQQAEDSKDE